MTASAKTTASGKKTELPRRRARKDQHDFDHDDADASAAEAPEHQPGEQAGTRLQGTDLMTAAEGFRNLGQFVAAVNVSNNLGIDFVNLKTSMVDDGLSLGQAIQTWKPTANSTQEASLAESQATVIINTSSTVTTSTAKTRKPKSTSGGGLND
jgi:hypothetical protein